MLHGMDTRYIATPKDTVEALLEAGNRLKGGGVPLRRTFVQQGSRDAPQPGPLASLVHNGDQRGLDTFLLLKAVASVSPFDSHRSAAVWARALRHTGVSANEQTVSRIWRRLEGLRLVARSKTGRVANITLLKPPLVLPAEKAPEWYGISADTAQRGLASLMKHDVLKVTRTHKPAPLAPKGFTYDSHYTLQGAFRSEWGGSDDD